MADLSIRHDGNGDIETLPFKIKKRGRRICYLINKLNLSDSVNLTVE